MNETIYKAKHPIRIVTATALFDGHDASINIMRRMLMESGVEVIHLAHNRSVQEIVDAAIEEDAQGIAMSSYQGGHVEGFKYIIDLLNEKNATHIRVFGGGGGVIVPHEIQELHDYGVCKIFSPEDGATLGLQGMINYMIEKMDFSTLQYHNLTVELKRDSFFDVAGAITAVVEEHEKKENFLSLLNEKICSLDKIIPVIGITGTGGAGKSSLTDEILLRFTQQVPDISIAVISCDPTRRKTGGALLGDRIRMNTLKSERIFMRSLGTRDSSQEISKDLPSALNVVKCAGFDFVILETAGIGQGDSSITELSDISLYVMTSEFGAQSQLEKIDMLDYADLVAINKYEKRGSEDALRDVRKQVQRNRKAFHDDVSTMPVYGTIASKFNDDGVTALFFGIVDILNERFSMNLNPKIDRPKEKYSSSKTIAIPADQERYLSDIAHTVRYFHQKTFEQESSIRKQWHIEESLQLIGDKDGKIFQDRLKEIRSEITLDSKKVLAQWNEHKVNYGGKEFVYSVRDKEIRLPLYSQSLSRLDIPKISLPKFVDPAEIYRWMRKENLPGYFPYTAGVFPLKRVGEDPTRMFAGEGGPRRTNKRFKLLSEGLPANRLSTAFDSATLYGFDPDRRPDIYGKVGTSGVSICCLDDMIDLYDGFDLCAPTTSVSMTINGPAPIILAMFLNTAVEQQCKIVQEEKGRVLSEDEREQLFNDVVQKVRGTVQADILKEDQGQNTCIFSIEFALKMMGDIQEYFIRKSVRNFYSVSISGYHIAEAGANPITQLALTLSNGFTYVEYYLARGMDINDFAPNLSFFFSNGLDPEYTVLGRVARRIWAIALREKYGAKEKSQKLKYHIQTSGRSLHSQEIQFNDIRTTLQALCAIYDNCNSLHTNAYDEAITTPSTESVRRALAIQLIINKEWGLAKNENMNQGSFIIEELTDLVEEAVLCEFERICKRGGVLGAMETGYQRSQIQDESLYYESLKHSGELPIVGVNMFRNPEEKEVVEELELARATNEEKDEQLLRLDNFKSKHESTSQEAIKRLKNIALSDGNIFEELLVAVRHCSLGEITNALFDVGGQYRRNM